MYSTNSHNSRSSKQRNILIQVVVSSQLLLMRKDNNHQDWKQTGYLESNSLATGILPLMIL